MKIDITHGVITIKTIDGVIAITTAEGVVTIITDNDEVFMATLQDVQSAIADLQATGQAVEDGVDRVLVVVQALRDQIAAGGSVSEADLDSVMTQLTAAKQPLSDSLVKEQGV